MPALDTVRLVSPVPCVAYEVCVKLSVIQEGKCALSHPHVSVLIWVLYLQCIVNSIMVSLLFCRSDKLRVTVTVTELAVCDRDRDTLFFNPSVL